jgi:hypothetical protein
LLKISRETQYSLKACDSHEPGHLTYGDIDGRSCHETADCRERNELYDPANPKQANPEDNKSTDECNSCCNLRTFPFIRMRTLDVFDDLRNCERHNCHRANGHILRGSKELRNNDI